ncbi:hypothetical protein GCM10011608_09880 [Micromonospora sonchi]|uniref:DUF4082 domain-containing protein n=1 Tax=Micromonospora sonchi TaxID=1763543 RepID=A0A917TKY0_9ACTN|nr:DUF4082 domain-containing protein [Micromonospora sonchi]GGM27127.1 hypothetical protein GCM10011608_09880 [Micromonospora sonchi]
MASIFAGSPGPATTYDDGTTLELGMVWRTAADGVWTGVRVWGPSPSPGSVVVSGWRMVSDVTGALLAESGAAPVTSGVWTDVPFTEPVPVTAGVYYCAQYRTGSSYTATPGFFTSGEVAAGDLTAIQHNVEPPGDPFNNGRFLAGAGFAAGNGGGAWYGIDVLVTVGAPPVEAAADLPAVSALSAAAGVGVAGQSGMSAVSAFAATPTRVVAVSARMTAVGVLDAGPAVTAAATSSLDGISGLSADPLVAVPVWARGTLRHGTTSTVRTPAGRSEVRLP